MTTEEAEKRPLHQVGRYAIFDRIAAGGMATVHLARLTGSEGFSRVVAIKRMHRNLLENAEFQQMFVAEARLAARVRHPNVVPILDVLVHRKELFIVMEYVHGESLQALIRAMRVGETRIPMPVLASIMVATLQGLHAAHEARDEKGEPLGIVHRDVSPHNVLVGADGVARVLDFGVAKAMHAQQDTQPGMVKGKFSYLAPEVIHGEPATRQSDVFSASTVLWELLTGRKLFGGPSDEERLRAIVRGNYPSPADVDPELPEMVCRIVMRGLRLDLEARYATALEMAIDLERELPLASQRVVGEWVTELSSPVLEARAALIHDIETSDVGPLPTSIPPAIEVPTPVTSLTGQALAASSASPHAKAWFWPAVTLAGALVSAGAVVTTLFEAPAPGAAVAVPAAPGPVTSLAPARAAQPANPTASASTAGPSVAPIVAPAASSAAPAAEAAPSKTQVSTARRGKRAGGAKDFLPEEL